MSAGKHWIVDLYIDAEGSGRVTTAVARLRRDFGERHPMQAEGRAHRRAGDRQDIGIGAELAAARALFALAARIEAKAQEAINVAATPALHASR